MSEEEIELVSLDEEDILDEEDLDEVTTVTIENDFIEFDDEDLTEEHADIIEDIKILTSDLHELEVSKNLIQKKIELQSLVQVGETELETLEETLEELEAKE